MIPKFRLWLDESKTMLRVWRLTEADDGELEVCVGGIKKKDRNYFDLYDILIDGQNILMQSTGLLDKNGVEIFEGDVVRIHVFDTYIKGSVEYSKQYASFVVRIFEYNEIQILSQFTSIEKIGNIYENPNTEE